MTQTSSQAVFFGSGPVAAASLELLQKNFIIEAVITKPSTMQQMQNAAPDVKIYSVSNKADLDGLITSSTFESSFAILIDFGIIVSQAVIDHFPLGIINSHFSLLPQLRGADPITFSILSGQKSTGVSLMLLSAGMDEGLIVAQSPLDIDAKDTSESLTARLIELSDDLLKECIPMYLDGSITPLDQTSSAELMGIDTTPTYSQKLSKDDGRIIWTKPAEVIEREIRAYYTWPKSYTTIAGIDVIIRESEVSTLSGEPGEYIHDKKSLTVYCGKDALHILKIQPAGKKEMPIAAFLAGYSSLL